MQLLASSGQACKSCVVSIAAQNINLFLQFYIYSTHRNLIYFLALFHFNILPFFLNHIKKAMLIVA